MALYAFDGTWNSTSTLDDVVEDSDTNVVCFYEFYRGPTKWYASGVGTRHGLPGRIIAGLFGAGAQDRLGEAYRQLCKNFAAGDRDIDIVGFSRGAALALDFANRIKDMDVRELLRVRKVLSYRGIRHVNPFSRISFFVSENATRLI